MSGHHLPFFGRVVFCQTETEEDETRCDQFLLQFLTAFMGICRKCSGAIRSVEFAEGFSKIWSESTSC